MKVVSVFFSTLALLFWAGCSDNALISKPVSNANLTTAATQTNIAINKTATASSVQSANPAASGNDNGTTTRWCASSATVSQWWKVDLGSSLAITGTEVMWEKAAAGYKYKIETSTDNSTWSLQADLTNNTSSAQTQTQTFPCIARYVRITTTGLPANTWASFYEFRVFSGNTVVSAPTNVKATAQSSTNVLVSFDYFADGVTIYAEYSTDGTNFIQYPATDNSINYVGQGWLLGDALGGFQPNTTYTFRLRAQIGTVYSAYSNTATAKTLTAPVPPTAPTNLKATTVTKPLPLTWTDNSTDETGFYIDRTDPWGTTVTFGPTAANVKSYSDATILTGITYQYVVYAYNANGNSANSNIVTVLVGTNPVANPGFESTGSWTIWNSANAHQTNYPHSGTYSGTLGSGACSLQQTVSGLTANTTYTLSGWGLTGGSGGVYDTIYIGVKNFGGTETKAQFTPNRWGQQSLTFKTGASNTSAAVYFYKKNGVATSYVDDMVLSK